jgi:cellulose biosynthesis protein BcsQ
MAKIIMFGNQKGGVGKSQCSLLVATALSQPPFNLKVCVVDTDTQKSIIRLRSLDTRAYPDTEPPFPVLEMTVAQMQKKLPELDKTYQVIVLDTAGKLDTEAPIESQEITKTMLYVDYLFIPFVAGNFNLQASLDYLKYALSIQKERKQKATNPRQLNVIGFVNMFDNRTKKNKILLEDVRKLVTAAPFPFMESRLGDYVQFSEADTYTSFYAFMSSEPAKANFALWLNEFVKIIN